MPLVLNFEILEHHKLRYVVVARAELALESLCLNPGTKNLSVPVYKVTEAYTTKSSQSAMDDSTVKSHNPTPHGVRFGTLYLNVTTKVQEQVYRWFWHSLLHHISYTSSLPTPLSFVSPSAISQPRPTRPSREGLLKSGEVSPDDLSLDGGSPPVSRSPTFDESALPPLTLSGSFGVNTLSSDNLKDMILLLGIETSDEEFEDVCTFLDLERPATNQSPVRSRVTRVVDVQSGQNSQATPKPRRPFVPIDDFMANILNVTPRRPPTPLLSSEMLSPTGVESLVEPEQLSPVASLFLGNQREHDEYIWETALVNDGSRITHLVVGQELRPSAQLLQTADAAYEESLSSSPPGSGLSHVASSSSSTSTSTSPTGSSILRSSLSSAYGFLSRFSSRPIRERRKDVIFLQDRETGKVVEEKMPQYLRRMLRGMYSNPTGRGLVNRGMSKSLLKRLTFNQAKKYTAPSSVSEIPSFIHFHNIDENEFLDPVSSFANFNEFFIRKLRVGVRPITAPEDPAWAISPADCRLHVYETLTEAQRLWIKGKTFSLKTLLDDPQLEQDFAGCSLVIARLAPQDYHRFHYPVSGFSGKYFSQGDAYYTVNPIAIRENVDVYSLNKRTSVIVESPDFGKVMIICVGATMVGSVVLTSGEDVYVNKGQELGYFQFGGSTLLVLFQRGRIRFDDDLLFNSAKQQETLVKMGTSLGRANRPASTSSYSA
jgi:phosphatidylserine decarboxylase